MTITLLLLALADDPFVIRVVDDAGGRGVPLVELRTTNGIVLHTDNAGVVAFEEPGLLGKRVFFFVESHGYEFPADGFGMRGAALETKPGGEATLKIRRVNVAERLYRITGQGLYHHSIRAGLPVPLKGGAANAGVMGQDTAGGVVHDGKLRWFWGDTSLAKYALGHFGTATATSGLPDKGGLDPDAGIELAYAVDKDGNSRPTFDLGRPGAIWVHSPFVLKDPEGRDRILVQFERVKDVSHRLELGIAAFDDATERFAPVKQLPVDEERHPFGQAFQDGDWLVFALPYPLLRVRATWNDVMDPACYEAFTCLPTGERYDAKAPKVERDAAGKVVYAWKRGAVAVDVFRQAELIKAGVLKADEAWIRTVDASTGKPVQLHRGSVRWNEFRKRWVMIATRMGGDESPLGDVYYAEAERPEGPWPKAVKVVGHKRYTFYNPVHHAFFDKDGGRVIYFEGTYTTSFSDVPTPTPRYDYNQILYRLDLADPRLRFP